MRATGFGKEGWRKPVFSSDSIPYFTHGEIFPFPDPLPYSKKPDNYFELAAVQINDDNDLEDIFKSIDDDAFSSTLGASKSAKKGTPKLKKKVKKMNMSISGNSSGLTKKRVLTELPTQPSKKPKIEKPKVVESSEDEEPPPLPATHFDDDDFEDDDFADSAPKNDSSQETKVIKEKIDKISMKENISKPIEQVQVQPAPAKEIGAEIDWNSTIKETIADKEEEEVQNSDICIQTSHIFVKFLISEFYPHWSLFF